MTTDRPAARTRSLFDWMRLPALRDSLINRGGRGARVGAVALVDQCIVSGVNFVTALVLARFMRQAEYGAYALIFAALLFVNGLQIALITSPLMVITPRYEQRRIGAYLNSLWAIQIAWCAISGALAAGVMLADRLWWRGITAGIGVAPFVLLLVTYLAQEFVRRALFSQRDGMGGLYVDLVSYGAQVIGLGALIVTRTLDLRLTLWVIGLTSLLACGYGFVRMRPLLAPFTRSDLADTWREHWAYGRWLTTSTMAQWSSAQLYFFVVAAALSATGTAMLAASRNLLGFTNIFFYGLENFIPGSMARRLIQGGPDAMDRWVKRFRLALATGIGVYCLAVAIFADPLMRLFYGGRYKGLGLVVVLISLANFLMALSRPPMFALQAMRAPRWVFFARITSALVTIVSAYALVTTNGVLGAAIGLNITQVIGLVFAEVGYRRVLRAHRQAEKMTR